jgi:hypothetical protein
MNNCIREPPHRPTSRSEGEFCHQKPFKIFDENFGDVRSFGHAGLGQKSSRPSFRNAPTIRNAFDQGAQILHVNNVEKCTRQLRTKFSMETTKFAIDQSDLSDGRQWDNSNRNLGNYVLPPPRNSFRARWKFSKFKQ